MMIRVEGIACTFLIDWFTEKLLASRKGKKDHVILGGLLKESKTNIMGENMVLAFTPNRFTSKIFVVNC